MSEHISQELAKRLHGKGFRAEHRKNWVSEYGSSNISDSAVLISRLSLSGIPAYTFTELWAVLPHRIQADELPWDCKILKKNNGNILLYYGNSWRGVMVSPDKSHESPAEAAGLMVEWLIDNGHMEVE